MMTEELNWELPPELRGILEHRTWRQISPLYCSAYYNMKTTMGPAHTTDKYSLECKSFRRYLAVDSSV